MKLITKEIDKQLDKQGQMLRKDETKGLKAIARFFHPFSSWETYLIAYSMESNNDYIFALTKGDFIEYGDIYLPEIEKIKIGTLPMERDLYFKAIDIEELYKQLKANN